MGAAELRRPERRLKSCRKLTRANVERGGHDRGDMPRSFVSHFSNPEVMLALLVTMATAACDRSASTAAANDTAAAPSSAPTKAASSTTTGSVSASSTTSTTSTTSLDGATLINFDDEPTGAPSPSFEAVIGAWNVVDGGGAHALEIKGSSGAGGFPLAIAKAVIPAGDLRIAVRFQPLAGAIDQAAGIAFAIAPTAATSACAPTRSRATSSTSAW